MPRVAAAVLLLVLTAVLVAPGSALAAGKRTPKRVVKRTQAVLKPAQVTGPTLPAYGLGHVKSEWLAGYNGAEGADLNGLHDLDLMHAAGAQLYRASFRLDQVQDPTGAFTRWTMLDNLMLQAAARDITLLPILIRMSETNGYLPPHSDEDRAQLGAFAAAAAARYGPGGTFWTRPDSPCASCEPHPIRVWEVWNEQNAAPYWDEPDPASYGATLVAARTGLRSVDPSARILLGGLADTEGLPGSHEIAPRDFLRRVIAAVGPNAFDAVAVHSYHPDPVLAADRIKALAQTMATYGGKQRSGAPRQQLWITEFGRPTTPGDDASAQGQAVWMKRFLDRVNANRAAWNLGPMLAYCVRDARAATESWHLLGLRTTTADDGDGGPKPAWNVFVARSSVAPEIPLPALR